MLIDVGTNIRISLAYCKEEEKYAIYANYYDFHEGRDMEQFEYDLIQGLSDYGLVFYTKSWVPTSVGLGLLIKIDTVSFGSYFYTLLHD